MKLANILFIASAVSFVAAYDVCAQNTATKTAPAADKTTQALEALPKTPSPMTEAQKIDFIKGATEDEMKNFITNTTPEELIELGDNFLKEAQKNPSNTELLKKIIKFSQLVQEITGEQTEQSKKTLAQLQAQADFQKGMVEQADKKLAANNKIIEQARKEKEQADKESQELADGFGN